MYPLIGIPTSVPCLSWSPREHVGTHFAISDLFWNISVLELAKSLLHYSVLKAGAIYGLLWQLIMLSV
jgi:hypothetical protein